MIAKLKYYILHIFHFLDYLARIPIFYYHLCFNTTVKNQRVDVYSIPVIIINYNQLFYLKKNVKRLLELGFKNIVIIDNASSFEPLLDYYEELDNHKSIFIERLEENLGHLVLFKKKELFNKYCKGFYILTDADVVLNEKSPKDIVDLMIDKLIKKHYFLTKIGVALDISDIPDNYPLKDKVLSWENQFWIKQYESDKYFADIDTTFALYKPNFYPYKYSNFMKGIRLAGNYSAKHGGWYILPGDLQEERDFYFKNNLATSWIYDNDGKLENNSRNNIYSKD